MKGKKQLLQIVLTSTQDMGLHAQECAHMSATHTHAHMHTSTCAHTQVGSKDTKQTKRNFLKKKKLLSWARTIYPSSPGYSCVKGRNSSTQANWAT